MRRRRGERKRSANGKEEEQYDDHRGQRKGDYRS